MHVRPRQSARHCGSSAGSKPTPNVTRQSFVAPAIAWSPIRSRIPAARCAISASSTRTGLSSISTGCRRMDASWACRCARARAPVICHSSSPAGSPKKSSRLEEQSPAPSSLSGTISPPPSRARWLSHPPHAFPRASCRSPRAAGALERKLDIKPQTHFAVVASDGDASWLKELLTSVPVGAIAQRGIDSSTTLALFVVSMRPGLATAFRLAQKRLPSQASFWIIHPKQTSPLAADFNQDDVRKTGLAQGFVDYKVCAVDKDWSALKFARRGTTKAKRHVMRRA